MEMNSRAVIDGKIVSIDKNYAVIIGVYVTHIYEV